MLQKYAKEGKRISHEKTTESKYFIDLVFLYKMAVITCNPEYKKNNVQISGNISLTNGWDELFEELICLFGCISGLLTITRFHLSRLLSVCSIFNKKKVLSHGYYYAISAVC